MNHSRAMPLRYDYVKVTLVQSIMKALVQSWKFNLHWTGPRKSRVCGGLFHQTDLILGPLCAELIWRWDDEWNE